MKAGRRGVFVGESHTSAGFRSQSFRVSASPAKCWYSKVNKYMGRFSLTCSQYEYRVSIESVIKRLLRTEIAFITIDLALFPDNDRS